MHMCSLWFCDSVEVLMKCFTRDIHWGAATQCVIPDLGNGFTDIISLTWHWMCNLWVSNGSEISWPCIISSATEIERFFFFIAGKMQSLIYGTHKHGGDLSCYSVTLQVLLLKLSYIYIICWPFLDFQMIPCIQKPHAEAHLTWGAPKSFSGIYDMARNVKVLDVIHESPNSSFQIKRCGHLLCATSESLMSWRSFCFVILCWQ